MFRTALFPLLCAASFATAIPLHIGESWVWQVTNRDSLDLTYRSAVVVDSYSIPAGKVWTLLASDSILKQLDTAKILVRPSDRQNWLRQSRFLGWELEPRRWEDTTVVIQGTDTSSVWGEASSLEPSQRAGRITASGRSRVSVDSNSVDWVDPPFTESSGVPVSTSPNSYSVPLPIHAWSEAHGWEGALTFPSKGRGMDWRLVSHNNQAIVPPQDALKIPAVNTETHWFMTVVPKGSTEYNIDVIPTSGVDHFEKIHWKVIQHDPDSAGWKSASIQQSRTSGYRYWASFQTTNAADTTWKDPVVETLQFRFHPGRGQSFGIPADLPPLEEGWIARWEDLPKGKSGGISNHSWSRNVWRGKSSARLEITRKDGQLASLLSSDNSCYGNCWFDGTIVVNTPGYTAQLVRVVPPGGDSSGTGTRVRYLQPAPPTLAMIAAQHPSLAIRWSTASGRTGTLTASEFVQSPAALRGQAVFLQARLPDGRLWQGTHVVP